MKGFRLVSSGKYAKLGVLFSQGLLVTNPMNFTNKCHNPLLTRLHACLVISPIVFERMPQTAALADHFHLFINSVSEVQH